MALPVIEKTWNFSVNNIFKGFTDANVSYRALLWTLKERFKSLLGWTVLGSSDSVNAALDGVDRWITYANVIFCNGAGLARSWIVFQNAALLPNFQILIDYATNGADVDGSNLTVAVSPVAGFTGGLITARPTATDEIVLNNGLSGEKWYGNAGVTFNNVINMMWTADGFMRLVMCYGKSYSYWFFERQKAPPAGIASDIICGVRSGTSDVTYLTYTYFNDAARAMGRHSANYTAFMTSEFYMGQAIGERIGYAAMAQGSPLSPIGLVSETAGARGRLGRMYDLWWGPTSLADGSLHRSSSGYATLIQFGHLVMPWPGPAYTPRFTW